MDSQEELSTGRQSNNRSIAPQEAHQMMLKSGDYVLLDVRTPSEYRRSHIGGAVLIPLNELNSRAPAEIKDKHVPIFVYCNSGTRATKAAKTLAQMGYTNVLNFGGITNWPYETVSG